MQILTIPNNKHGLQELENFKTDMQNLGYEITSTRKTAGYISRRITAIISEYEGMHGYGYKVEMPSFDSTGYHYIFYVVMPGTADK